MKLKTPFIIDSTLSPSLRIADATLALHLPLFPAEKARWGATMILEAPGIALTDTTLRSGLSGFRSLVDPFSTYLSMLDAAAEAREGGDNADLFPPNVMQWARENASAIAQARNDLQDELGAVRHDLISEEDV
jgi:hypothetical protein